jgi:hypothetical protein
MNQTILGRVVEPLEVVGGVNDPAVPLFSVLTQVMVWATAEKS